MNSLPFPQALLLWRRARGLTQSELAQRARVPQPNLSDIERGAREVSLRALRALAAALDVRPGLLVDGTPPAATHGADPRLSRDAVERIADAVAFKRSVRDPGERVAVEALRALLTHRTLAARGRRGRARIARRRALAAWVQLKSVYGRAAVQLLADRVLERQQADDSARD